MVGVLQQQLGDVVAAKETALSTIASVLSTATANNGVGPTYTISGPDGSETLDVNGYLRMLTEQVRTYTELERTILEMLQDLQPFTLRIRMRVGGGGVLGSGIGRWW